jgi:hypothetical protein|mmetsp:Transcript_71912/g.120617  ORF Transcript_71912/g.120617 Transcript_71912/m.120617 type:complete len:93 (+) Transcript_71912:1051-1329(+)
MEVSFGGVNEKGQQMDFENQRPISKPLAVLVLCFGTVGCDFSFSLLVLFTLSVWLHPVISISGAKVVLGACPHTCSAVCMFVCGESCSPEKR